MKTAALVLSALALLAQSAPPDPAAILASTRDALGGEKKLSAVKTIVASGRTQQVRGNNLVPIEFEINIELPDKYVRKNEIPAQESGPSVEGFNGDALIQTKAQTVKQDFARLMLAMFGTSFSGFPLTFTYAGQAEAPQGRADVLDAKGPGNAALRLFIDRATHLPVLITWPGQPSENRVFLSEYRDVDGMKWPFRIRRASGADTVEETTFDRFRVNARIDAKKFQP
ncbi:MAG TPA: hypothetical protein VN628_00120 [Vicinamibacterales bacterium]|nr:hypothetical protein [Vicinamibacterales bacterium]